jgi:exosome complex exonuclease RRP6
MPALRDVFANPYILKVFHGADKDIEWLQRDFSIYVVNMFDTGQAARELAYPSFSLAFLLKTFCDVDTDKRY